MLDSHLKARSIRVLVVDDHATVRQELRCTLEGYPSIEVVGEASDGDEALACVAKAQPTVVVMDIVMPKMDGIAAMERFRIVPSARYELPEKDAEYSTRTRTCLRCSIV